MVKKGISHGVQEGMTDTRLRLLLDKLHGERHLIHTELIGFLSKRCAVAVIDRGVLDDHTLSQCDVLVLIAPKKKWRAPEAAAIGRFVQAGGFLLALIEGGRRPERLNTLLEPYGLSIGKDAIQDTILEKRDLSLSRLLEGTGRIVLTEWTATPPIRVSAQAEVLLKYKDVILGARSPYGNGAIYLFSCLAAFESPLWLPGNKNFLLNIVKALTKPEMRDTLDVIERNQGELAPREAGIGRTQPLTGELEECWRVDLKELGIRKGPGTAIALDARRILIGADREVYILDFNGRECARIQIPWPVSSVAVNSACSRVLVGNKAISGKPTILGYTIEGEEILRLELPYEGRPFETDVSTSLDGQLSIAKGSEYVTIWDWEGAVICHARSDRGSSYSGPAAFQKVEAAPDGSYALFDDSGINTRNAGLKIWSRPVSPEDTLEHRLLHHAAGIVCYSAANNMFAIAGKLSISVFDVAKGKPNVVLSEHPLVEQPGYLRWAGFTSDGRHICYIAHRKSRKEATFNLFDLVRKTSVEDSAVYPAGCMPLTMAHDGTVLLSVVDRQLCMHRVI